MLSNHMLSVKCLFTILSIILCLLSLGEHALAADTRCPIEPAPGTNAFTLQQAWSPHVDWPEEDYYMTGTLCVMDSEQDFENENLHQHGSAHDPDCANPMGFLTSTILANLTVGRNTVLFAQQHLEVSYTSHFVSVSNGAPVLSNFPAAGLAQPAVASYFNIGFASTSTLPATAVATQFQLVSGTPGTVGSAYKYTARSNNISMDLSLISATPTLFQGDGGWWHIATAPNSTCSASYYASMPRLWTVGTITLNGVSYAVKGSSWMDNTWANPAVNGYQKAWTFSWIRLGSRRVMFYLPEVAGGVQLYNSSTVEVADPSGTVKHGSITKMEVLASWQSPASGFIYPTDVIFHTTFSKLSQVHLYVDPDKPWFINQEIVPPTKSNSYWEGLVLVEVADSEDDHHGEPTFRHVGNGYLERRPPTS